MPLKWQRKIVRDTVVLITGASDGIGAACAHEFRRRGARLSLTGRSEQKLARVARDGDLTTAADLMEEGTPRLLVDRTLERFGRIDLLMNNAGHGIYCPVSESGLRETKALFELNLFAPLALAQAVLPQMRAQGSGVIANVGSIAGRVMLPWMPVYSASKSALGLLTESLRREVATDGIHVMLIMPGYVLTDFQAHAPGGEPPRKVVASKRFAITPERCAREIVEGVERRARVVMTPRSGWVLAGLHRWMPGAVQSHLAHLNRPVERA